MAGFGIGDNPLDNPLVLSKTLRFLNFRTLQTCRYVSQFWRSLVTPLVALRSRVVLIFHGQREDEISLSEDNSTLFRNLTLIVLSDEGFLNPRWSSALQCIKQCHGFISELEIELSLTSGVVRLVCLALVRNEFPVLRRLKLKTLLVRMYEEAGPETKTLQEMKALSNLTSVEFEDASSLAKNRARLAVVKRRVQDLIQAVISKASGLQEITVKDNFFPDLEGKEGIKKMDMQVSRFEQNGRTSDPDFSVTALSRMLEQTHRTLTHLALGDSDPASTAAVRLAHPDVGPGYVQEFVVSLPSFLPVLRSLEVNSIDIMPANPKDWLTAERFPKLESLTLRAFSTPEEVFLFKFFKPGKIDGLRELNLELSTTSEVGGALGNLRWCFPNVRRLSIQTWDEENGRGCGWKTAILLAQDVFPCLEEIRVGVDRFRMDALKELLAQLRDVDDFGKLKNLKFEFNGKNSNFQLSTGEQEDIVKEFEGMCLPSESCRIVFLNVPHMPIVLDSLRHKSFPVDFII